MKNMSQLWVFVSQPCDDTTGPSGLGGQGSPGKMWHRLEQDHQCWVGQNTENMYHLWICNFKMFVTVFDVQSDYKTGSLGKFVFSQLSVEFLLRKSCRCVVCFAVLEEKYGSGMWEQVTVRAPSTPCKDWQPLTYIHMQMYWHGQNYHKTVLLVPSFILHDPWISRTYFTIIYLRLLENG